MHGWRDKAAPWSLVLIGILIAPIASAQAPQHLGDLLNNSPGLNLPAERTRVVEGMRQIENNRKSRARTEAVRRGLALRRLLPDGQLLELVDWQNGEPRYLATTNFNAAVSTAADLLRPAPYSLSGAGVTIGLWDGGSARADHREFTGRVTVRDGSGFIDHATHVAGTLAAKGIDPTARGMADAVLIDSYDWNSDLSEMTGRAAAAPGESGKILLSNHSYNFVGGWLYLGGTPRWEWTGAGTTATGTENDFGTYNTPAREADTLAGNAPYYLMFRAAGNDRNENPAAGESVRLSSTGSTVTYSSSSHPAGDGIYRGGFDTIAFAALAKNVLTVGSVTDAVPDPFQSSGPRTLSAAAVSPFSSWGPTDDGRIKPDLVANGEGVYSSSSGAVDAYRSFNGTSMSSPNACGSASLLIELYQRLRPGQAMRASTLKGLLLHTADDLGLPGPDYKTGWGLMNVKRAADLIQSGSAPPAPPSLIENQLSSTVLTRTHRMVWDGVSPLRATLCWTDPAGTATTTSDSRTNRLVNNLNLSLISPTGTAYQPYVMPFVGTWTQASMDLPATTGTNQTDNIEQVHLEAPATPGIWQAVISVPASPATPQTYSLILSGTAPTAPFLTNITPDAASSGPVSFTLSGDHFLPGATVHFSRTGQPDILSTVTAVSGTSLTGTLSLTGMAPGRWDVRVTNPGGLSATAAAAFTVTAILWSQAFDAPYSGWTASASTGVSNWAQVSTASHTPANSWFASGPATRNTDNLVSEPIAIPHGASALRLGFQHRFNLSAGSDGGVLEFSLNNGSWFAVTNTGTAETFTTGGYNRTLTGTSNPLTGLPAWSGNSGTAFSGVVVALTDSAKYAGQSLRVRWRLSTNNSTASPGGWYVDSVKLEGIPGPPDPVPTSLTLTPATAQIPFGTMQAFTATVRDASGTPITPPPIVSWQISGGGTVDAAGLFTPTAAGGPFTITAVSGALSDTAAVTVSQAPATVSLGDLSAVYTGSPKPVTVRTDPPGLPVEVNYNNAPDPPSDYGSYAVSARITDPDYSGTASGNLTIGGISLNAWRTLHFTPEQLTGSEDFDTADPDKDGLTNLAEYALGTDPHRHTAAIDSHLDATGHWTGFQRPKALPDVIYHAETSLNLEQWDPLPLEILTDGPVQTVRVRNPGAVTGNIGFLKIRFSRP